MGGKKLLPPFDNGFGPFDLEVFERKHELDLQNRIKELSKISKPLHELVISENFLIEEVLGQSHGKSFTPTSETVFGGRSPIYDAGYSSESILKVLPEKNILVRTIFFNGLFPGLTGYKISAKIPKYKMEKIPPFFMNEGGTFYLDREFKSEESAIELSILSPEGKILRTDRSVDYFDFMKE